MRFLKGVILLSAVSVGVAVFYVFGILVGLWAIPIETREPETRIEAALPDASFLLDHHGLIRPEVASVDRDAEALALDARRDLERERTVRFDVAIADERVVDEAVMGRLVLIRIAIRFGRNRTAHGFRSTGRRSQLGSALRR